MLSNDVKETGLLLFAHTCIMPISGYLWWICLVLNNCTLLYLTLTYTWNAE
jgi:hypothetical protein